ncbi:putative histidine acid phosphatase [Drechmeria coniospora]|uniref:Putative histidine acid phosphatase n=1 Tax=Drechmeria coniospora TaxID=98403 RepID=A0A151GII9_DRECN|nr:putative histidine acid phosphatase [Drechmeria coniospora]KYK56898.1 putative histidine acid phosphatase [Drechmeria coniospora]
MRSPSALLLAAGLSAAGTANLVSAADSERILGVYLFHRHGDRTAKAWSPVNLTALGADQVHNSGTFYRARYVASEAGFRVSGLSSDDAVLSQLQVVSPKDAVLHNSALTFLQGLYPPTGRTELLANGSKIEAPLGGYQYIPIDAMSEAASGDRAESNAWLQGGSGCGNAVVSSNSYFASAEYKATYDDSAALYQSLLPVINSTYGTDAANFKNGYSIYDLINVATIHNSSISSHSLLTKETLARLYQLASVHEWNLAYNATEPVRSIAGAVLAGQILDALDAVVDGKPSAPKLNVQFGAYGTFMAFFGLAQLPQANADFYGVCNYASSMAFELVTTVQDAKPKPADISVRFLFANGTAADNGLKPFPLFGLAKETLSWNDFKSAMAKFAIADTEHWCNLCGNTSGKCANRATVAAGDVFQNPMASGKGVSKVVAGVIGALVTLVVILSLQAAIILLGGLRLVKKSSLSGVRRSADVGELGHK